MTQQNTAIALSQEDLATTYGLEPALVRDTANVEMIVAKYKPDAIAHLPPMTQAIVLGRGMKELREAMTEKLVRYVFMPLQGIKLGFRTDKDKDGGYPWEIVRDAAVEALMRGLRPIGNEFNIIGGNCYTTKEGFERKLTEFPGLTDLEITPGVPVIKDSSALVPFEAKWKIDGKPDELRAVLFPPDKETGEVVDTRIPVRVNSGQIVDAVVGKGKRKMLARIWERITGVKEDSGDVADVIDTVGVAVAEDKKAQGTDAAADELVAKHKAKNAAKKNGETPKDPAVDSSGHPEPGANDR